MFKFLNYVIVPDPNIVIIPSGPIQGATVGNLQTIECVVNTVGGVELSSVMISWTGPNGSLITNNSRIIVNPVTFVGNNFASGLHFIYLMEGDEGTYICNVKILDIVKAGYVELSNLTCKCLIIIKLVYCLFCSIIIV